MDSAQKRALLAILSMIEAGIQQLKMLLSVDGVDSHVIAEAPRPSADPGHLTDEEEHALDVQLEKERLAMLAFEQKRAEHLWQQKPERSTWGDDE